MPAGLCLERSIWCASGEILLDLLAAFTFSADHDAIRPLPDHVPPVLGSRYLTATRAFFFARLADIERRKQMVSGEKLKPKPD